MNNNRSIIIHIFYLIALLASGSCGVYSFTGTSISAETISIQNFYNEADQGPPNLSQTFSDKMRDYFQQNTNLTLITAEGELQFEGSIVSYRLSPVAPTASGDPNVADVAALTRLTITVKVVYLNITDDEFDFDKSFSFFADYKNDLALTAVEDRLIDEIFDQIILDIFNNSVANW
jgi:hypothetical protein